MWNLCWTLWSSNMHACACNAEHYICLSVYVNITVTCSPLECNQEYLKKFINYSSLFSLSDLTFLANSSGDPREKCNTSCLFIQSLLSQFYNYKNSFRFSVHPNLMHYFYCNSLSFVFPMWTLQLQGAQPATLLSAGGRDLRETWKWPHMFPPPQVTEMKISIRQTAVGMWMFAGESTLNSKHLA